MVPEVSTVSSKEAFWQSTAPVPVVPIDARLGGEAVAIGGAVGVRSRVHGSRGTHGGGLIGRHTYSVQVRNNNCGDDQDDRNQDPQFDK